ncbi:hypothetical protein SAMN04488057_11059 [Cyclobacterium lianum]|uniref:Uncharacterized protein n=1 Tax=Cyclobacterium lianum TaxID=388280 RepID=A0A1M7PRQ1_9BACT|nr:hypothetical protein [Cyclobacterium lianum]SHN20011.1 hypothetical protein SAMN04488057_11059 [Cyclobacterium lianum]
MNNVLTITRFFLLLGMTCFSVQSVRAQEELPAQHSFQTLQYLLSEQENQPSGEEADLLIEKLVDRMEYWNEISRQGDPGWKNEALKTFVNYGVEELAGFALRSPVLGRVSSVREPVERASGWLSEKVTAHFFERDAQEFARQRDFKVRETFEQTATSIVEDHCSGNVTCAEAVFEQVLNDRDVQEQILEADALGAFDEAQTRAYVKNAQENSLDNYEGVILEIDNLSATVNAAVSDVKATVINNFQELNENQEHIINTTARILHYQQENTIALSNLQEFVSAIDTKVDNITALQQQSLFVSNAIHEGMVKIDKRIIALSRSFEAMIEEERIEEIHEIFENSPINKKIKALEDKNSAISVLMGEEDRQTVLENLRVVKKKQDIVKATELIGRVGAVGKEALTVFCQSRDCPSEIEESINLGLALTDIVGNFTAGNWAKASLTALGIFKEPQPGPELRMLNQIRRQLEGLEANMNQGFKNVHEHLFALEENLGQRLDIIDLKLDQLSRELIQTRQDILQSLSRVDTKLNYIVNQNECIRDLVLEVTLEQNQDLCRLPAKTFADRIEKDEISDYEDLENFFRGGSCGSCIEALSKVNEQSRSSFFRYAACKPEGENNKASPNRIYDYAFNKLLNGTGTDKNTVHSLLYVPKNIRVLDSLKNALKPLEDSISFELKKEDSHYRNYSAVLDYANYVLTLFPFLEPYDRGDLLSAGEIRDNPGFSKERTRFLINQLEGTLDLINHTIFQQSLMAGNGVFTTVDQMLEESVSGFDDSGVFTLRDLFSHNPYFRKNYAAHLLDEVVGLEKIKDLIDHDRLENGPQRLVMKGYNIQIFEEDNTLVFTVSLNNLKEPEQHIRLFDGYLPVADGRIDEETYQRNLEFAYPSSITELSNMKNLVINRLGEMRMIASTGPKETALSPEEIADLIVLFR